MLRGPPSPYAHQLISPKKQQVEKITRLRVAALYPGTRKR